MKDVKFYHCSIGTGMPIGDIGGGIVGGIVKEGIKELAVSEGIRVGWCGCILIETLRGVKGDLEHISIVLVHFECLEKSKC
jgi:hypothetical protein